MSNQLVEDGLHSHLDDKIYLQMPGWNNKSHPLKLHGALIAERNSGTNGDQPEQTMVIEDGQKIPQYLFVHMGPPEGLKEYYKLRDCSLDGLTEESIFSVGVQPTDSEVKSVAGDWAIVTNGFFGYSLLEETNIDYQYALEILKKHGFPNNAVPEPVQVKTAIQEWYG